MFKKSEPPKQLIKLSSRPLLSDLQKYADTVVRARDKSMHICWNSSDNLSGYTLAITATAGSSDPQWRLTSQSGSVRKDLWFYVSSDINKIFSMCVASLGEDLAEAIAADTRAFGYTTGQTQAMGQGMAGSSSLSSSSSSSSSSSFSPTFSSSTPSSPDYANLTSMQRATGPLPSASPTEGLTGNLAVLHITNLLQSISMGKMTGRLHIEPSTGPVEVFFVLGAPEHAVSRQSSGEEAFLEVIALNNGSFVFEPGLRTDSKSITHALDSLILKGIQLVDCMGLIEGANVTIDSIVHRSQPGLSEQAFEQRIMQGAPLDMGVQKKFYIAVDGQLSIKQLAENLKLQRSEWVPVVSNLIKVGLANFTAAGPALKRTIAVQPKRFDAVVIEQFAHHLKRPDTGAFTYPAFLFFLHQEYLRYMRHETPFSVILIDIQLQKAGGLAARGGTMTPQSIALVVQCINSMRRELDMVTHYEGHTLAVLLPSTHAHEAVVVAKRVAAGISEAKIAVGMEKLQASTVIGVASIPGDVSNTGELLAAAEMAKEKASSSPEAIVQFSELA